MILYIFKSFCITIMCNKRKSKKDHIKKHLWKNELLHLFFMFEWKLEVIFISLPINVDRNEFIKFHKL